MILDLFSAKWTAVAPALGDHLWQSTLFAIIAGLLALLLRKNFARVRYWLWLAASLKFLIPFSLLVGLGSHLASPRVATGASQRFYQEIVQVSQPFTVTTMPPAARPVVPATDSASLVHLLPVVLGAGWLAGLIVVLLIWCARWRQVAAILRNSEPMQKGRELDILRRLERVAKTRRPLRMVLSRSSLEPGIFGIVRPVLIWPSGMSERLEDAHMEAILAHELGHVRRRDNLTAALHMVVEALFWFHPLAWWLGAQLAEERERACDEAVLDLGAQRQVYAQSILKTCEFCVEAPLACVSGVTGADLKKRIVRIMTQRHAETLSVGRRLLLGTIGGAVLAGPVIFGLVHAPRVRAQSSSGTPTTTITFDVASIKPDHSDGHSVRISFNDDSLTASGVTLKRLIEVAYNMNGFQLAGGPDWVSSETYELQAKMDESTVEALKKVPREQMNEQRRMMVQLLLAERFNLKVSHSSKELPIYALVVAKNGPKFSESETIDKAKTGFSDHDGDVTVTALTMGRVAQWLSRIAGRKVVDKTGLQGQYDFKLHYDDRTQSLVATAPAEGSAGTAAPPDSSGPSIFAALQDQLGLKLESQKGPVDTLIIESAEKPSPN
jgi:bla regulator protein blaR1